MTIGTSDGINKIGFLIEESTPLDKASVDFEDTRYPHQFFLLFCLYVLSLLLAESARLFFIENCFWECCLSYK